MNIYQIYEFLGIQQHKDGAFLDKGSASDANNMTTSDGNLSVNKPTFKVCADGVSESDRLGFALYETNAGKIAYAWNKNQLWMKFADGLDSLMHPDWQPVEICGTVEAFRPISRRNGIVVRIGTEDYVLFASGSTHSWDVAYKAVRGNVTPFGTGLYSFEGTVSAYNADTLTITASTGLSSEGARHALLDGITYDGANVAEVASVNAQWIVLKESPTVAPVVGNTLTVRGGATPTKASVFCEYAGRLFAGGDYAGTNNRLFWSAVEGDGRTLEDWYAVDGSEDASGGFVDLPSTEEITELCPLKGELLVFTNRGLWRLYGKTPSTFNLEKVCDLFNENIPAGSTVVQKGTAFALTRRGIAYYNGNGLILVDGAATIQKLLADLSEGYDSIPIVNSVVRDNILQFCCETGIIEYDTERGTTLVRKGETYKGIAKASDATYVLFADIQGTESGIYKLDHATGTVGAALWRTQETDLGAKYVRKQLRKAIFRASGGEFMFRVIAGDVTWEQKITPTTNNNGIIELALPVPPSYSFQFEFENINGSRFTIHGGIDILFEKEVRGV